MTDGDAPRIHPTALIEADVTIGERTAIWDGVHVRGPASIGRDCIIGEKTYVAYGVTIGDGVKLNAHVYVCTGVTIEDRVLVAAGTVFTNDRYPRAFDGCGRVASSAPTADTLTTIVRTGASIGARVAVGPGIEIGAYAMVAMGAVVTRDVPPHALVVGAPARVRGWVCVCGRPLATARPDGSPAQDCRACGRRYALTSAAPAAAARLETA
jgi:UDP-2-acetamido-3-amino-2,3-dideoxy-glucuronate N-acetyltransferase